MLIVYRSVTNVMVRLIIISACLHACVINSCVIYVHYSEYFSVSPLWASTHLLYKCFYQIYIFTVIYIHAHFVYALSVPTCISLSFCTYLYLSLCTYLYLTLYLYLPVSLSLCSYLYLSLFLYLPVSLSLYLPVSFWGCNLHLFIIYLIHLFTYIRFYNLYLIHLSTYICFYGLYLRSIMRANG
jgi:hypothetical protein